MLRRLIVLVTLFVSSCTATPAFAQDLPPIPSAVVSQLGPVRVEILPGLKCSGRAVLGCFSNERRTIYLRDSMPADVLWHTLFHEQFHVTLYDAGQSLQLPDGEPNPLEDKLADAVASARVNELKTLIRVLAVRANRAAVEQAGAARVAAPAPWQPPPAAPPR